jgi:hypothetical protein
MAETRFAVPVYRGWPERPYQLLGSLSHKDPNARWNDDFFAAAAGQAKRLNGDAVIIREGAEFGVTQIAGAKRDSSDILYSQQTTALVIRWLTQNEISDRNLLLDELLKRFFTDDPAVAANRTVGQVVMMYLLNSGMDFKSEKFRDQFIETMTKLAPPAGGSLSGGWIFKASESVGTALSSSDEGVFVGLASVSVDGENVAIVSNSGTAEVNFTGSLSKNRLNGQIGIGGVSAKCEGAATDEKISISFQSLTSDGMVRGNVVFQRATVKQNDNEKAKPIPSGSRSGARDDAPDKIAS